MTEVVIRVSKTGETTVKVEGHMGPSCSVVSQPYRNALGHTKEEVPTVEMYMEQPANHVQESHR